MDAAHPHEDRMHQPRVTGSDPATLTLRSPHTKETP